MVATHTPGRDIVSESQIHKAKASDKQLGIIRDRIPFAAVYIPSAPNSQYFFNLALAIGEIPEAEIDTDGYIRWYWA